MTAPIVAAPRQGRSVTHLTDALYAYATHAVLWSGGGRMRSLASSIDPELLIRMLLLGYCYGIRSERRLCEEVEDRLTFRWFCRLDLFAGALTGVLQHNRPNEDAKTHLRIRPLSGMKRTCSVHARIF